MCMLFGYPMRAEAYFGTDEDYLLRAEKPDNREKGHYLEYVNPDAESYLVQKGDTLWEIARERCGSGTAYHKLWEDNRELVDTPQTLQIGTKLRIQEKLYTAAGMQDYVRDEVTHCRIGADASAWEWDPDGYRYQLFEILTYRNDLGENAPYRNWEAFQREASACAERLCGGRVSELSFSRYRVTDLCDLCYYQFVFDGGDKRYLIMAALSCTDERESPEYVVYNGLGQALSMSCKNMKSEVFAVCDLDRCDEKDLQEAKGKTFYMAARGIDSLTYYPKSRDYVGAADWNYPQIHNPFAQAMESFVNEPLERKEGAPPARALVWKDAAFEKLVREELARLWALTEEEKKAFMERPVTAAELSGITNLSLYEDGEEGMLYLRLNGRDRIRTVKDAAALHKTEDIACLRGSLITLDDLAEFTELTGLELCLHGSALSDFSAIGRLRGLRELDLRLEAHKKRLRDQDFAFLGGLSQLRLLYLRGPAQEDLGGIGAAGAAGALEGVTDLSVLEHCPQLTYLILEGGKIESFSFLAKLPKLYYVNLIGRKERESEIRELLERSSLPELCFFYLGYNESIVFDIGGA